MQVEKWGCLKNWKEKQIQEKNEKYGGGKLNEKHYICYENSFKVWQWKSSEL